MRRLVLLIALVAASVPVLAADDLATLLTFEGPGSGAAPGGWGGGPPGTLFADTLVVHGGRKAGRIERTDHSAGTFSTFTTSLPSDVTGAQIELRGWLRTEDVTGWSGLWLREDATGGAVQFDNMQSRQLKGTTPWTEYTITLPLDGSARTIYFGALQAGAGRTWVDDLQLLVDGVPIDQAPHLERAPTILEIDHEFDGSSGIALSELNAVQTMNLTTLVKVWGFLKYHHPAITGGHRQWDYDLLRILPRVLTAKDREHTGRALADWIEDLGVPARCDSCAADPVDPALTADLAWLADTETLGKTLSARLQATYRFRRACDRQFYVDFVPHVGNPDFSRELPYETDGTPDAGYRILAVARYWNLVRYWFPYRNLIDDWDGALAEFLPRIVAATDRNAYQLELMALIARVGDTHANLWSSLDVRPPVGGAAIPVIVRFLRGEAVVTGYDHEFLGRATGIKIGDVIAQIDHRPVRELTMRWAPWYCASNQPTRLRDMARMLTRGPQGPCPVVIDRDGQRLDLTVTRTPLDQLDLQAGRTHDRPGPTCLRLTGDVAYLKLSTVSRDSVMSYLDTMQGTRGVVIDIRNYPSAFMVFDLTGHFVTQSTAFAAFTVADASNPGAFLWRTGLSLPRIAPLQPHYDGKIVVLVDETTQSSAEYTTMALRAAGATVVGSTTAGADGNVSRIVLPGGLQTLFSGIGVFYPDRSPTQRVGIVPDIVVTPTRAGIRAGKDEVLEAAIAEIGKL